MKIQQINSYSNLNAKFNSTKTNSNTIHFTNNLKNYELSTDEFNANKEQPPKEKRGIINWFKSLFTYEITPEEELNDEIDFTVSNIIQESKKTDKLHKIHYELAKNLIALGHANDWTQYCDLNRKKGEKLVFGKINEETNIPETITVVSMNEQMKTKRAYDFANGLDIFTAKDYTIPDIEDEILFIGKNPAVIQETNKFTNTTQKFIKTIEGLYYYEAEIGRDNQIKQIYTVLNYDTKTYENNEFVRFNGENFEIYHLNDEGLWQKTAEADEFHVEE